MGLPQAQRQVTLSLEQRREILGFIQRLQDDAIAAHRLEFLTAGGMLHEVIRNVVSEFEQRLRA